MEEGHMEPGSDSAKPSRKRKTPYEVVQVEKEMLRVSRNVKNFEEVLDEYIRLSRRELNNFDKNS